MRNSDITRDGKRFIGVVASGQTSFGTSGAPYIQVVLTSPVDHLVKATAALDAIPATALSGDAALKLADVKRRVAVLEQTYRSGGRRTMSKLEEARTHLSAFAVSATASSPSRPKP